MPKKMRMTDTSTQKSFRSPYKGGNSPSTKAVKAIQKFIRKFTTNK